MLQALTPRALSVLRIMAGFTFSLHGYQKLFGLVGGMGGRGMAAEFGSLLWTAAVLETFGSAALMLGLFTRPVAFLLCGEMAVAYFRQHAPHAFWPILNGGEPAVLYCFVFLYLAFAGPGTVSLDHWLRKRSVG